MPVYNNNLDISIPLETPDAKRLFLVGKAADQEFAIDLKEARGVATVGKIIEVPGANESISGLTYFRGGVEAVVDLAMVWGKGRIIENKQSRVVLVEADGRRAVIMVEELFDLFSSNPQNVTEEANAYELIGQVGTVLWNEVSIPLISASKILQSIS